MSGTETLSTLEMVKFMNEFDGLPKIIRTEGILPLEIKDKLNKDLTIDMFSDASDSDNSDIFSSEDEVVVNRNQPAAPPKSTSKSSGGTSVPKPKSESVPKPPAIKTTTERKEPTRKESKPSVSRIPADPSRFLLHFSKLPAAPSTDPTAAPEELWRLDAPPALQAKFNEPPSDKWTVVLPSAGGLGGWDSYFTKRKELGRNPNGAERQQIFSAFEKATDVPKDSMVGKKGRYFAVSVSCRPEDLANAPALNSLDSDADTYSEVGSLADSDPEPPKGSPRGSVVKKESSHQGAVKREPPVSPRFASSSSSKQAKVDLELEEDLLGLIMTSNNSNNVVDLDDDEPSRNKKRSGKREMSDSSDADDARLDSEDSSEEDEFFSNALRPKGKSQQKSALSIPKHSGDEDSRTPKHTSVRGTPKNNTNPLVLHIAPPPGPYVSPSGLPPLHRPSLAAVPPVKAGFSMAPLKSLTGYLAPLELVGQLLSDLKGFTLLNTSQLPTIPRTKTEQSKGDPSFSLKPEFSAALAKLRQVMNELGPELVGNLLNGHSNVIWELQAAIERIATQLKREHTLTGVDSSEAGRLLDQATTCLSSYRGTIGSVEVATVLIGCAGVLIALLQSDVALPIEAPSGASTAQLKEYAAILHMRHLRMKVVVSSLGVIERLKKSLCRPLGLVLPHPASSSRQDLPPILTVGTPSPVVLKMINQIYGAAHVAVYGTSVASVVTAGAVPSQIYGALVPNETHGSSKHHSAVDLTGLDDL